MSGGGHNQHKDVFKFEINLLYKINYIKPQIVIYLLFKIIMRPAILTDEKEERGSERDRRKCQNKIGTSVVNA